MKIVCFCDIVKLGRYFIIEYICNIYLMVDSFIVVIIILVGVVIYIGDFKIDYIFVDGEKFDL